MRGTARGIAPIRQDNRRSRSYATRFRRTRYCRDTHPSINIGYVLSGHLTAVRRSDGKRLALGPGDVVPEMVDGAHRGETGDERAELIVFYAGAPGTPLTVPDHRD
ncbi:cupin [Burkholderia lata]|nr:cupin [Burkholderia lata]